MTALRVMHAHLRFHGRWSHGRAGLAAALAVLAISFSAAFYIHQRQVWSVAHVKSVPGTFGSPFPYHYRHQRGWTDRAVMFVAFGGLAVAVSLIAYPRPNKPS